MEIVKNKEKNGIELYFNVKPANEVLRLLKDNHWRWHTAKKCWYTKYSELAMKVVDLIKNNNVSVETLQEKIQENELGVKVGDIFSMSWGYEQTNVDFFQVVALKGKTQVVIKEVILQVKNEEYMSHGMARDVEFDINNKDNIKILDKSYLVDNDKGTIKKVKGTKENPYISFDLGIARKYKGQKLYESWYY